MLRDHLEDILIFWSMGWDDGLNDKMKAAYAALKEYDRMNQLVLKQFGTAAAVARFAGALRASSRRLAAGGDTLPILKMDEDGYWSFGEENTAVERDDLWAVNPLTIKHGFIAFDGKQMAETVDGERAEILVSIDEEPPHPDDLPELYVSAQARKRKETPQWKAFQAYEMVCVDGANKGAQVVYKPASMGGGRMCRMLGEEIARRYDDIEKSDAIVPLIELDSRGYENQRHGKFIYNPTFHVGEWVSLDTDTFEPAEPEEREERPAKKVAKGKAADKRSSRAQEPEDDDRPARARDARKGERTAKGEPVDKRRSARDEEPAEDADFEEENDAKEAPRGRRGRDVEAKAERAPRGEVRGRRARDEEPEEDAVEDERPARGARRARDEEPAEEPRRGGVRGRTAETRGRGR